MKIGLAKVDITPRVGVELCGFGPFINRHSMAVRDRLWAKAVAFEAGGATAVLVSCDLIGFELDVTHHIRRLVHAATGLPPEAIMVHATHTHSGPCTTRHLRGWGAPDAPYLEVLPFRVARACIQAVQNRRDATLSHAEVPCEGIGLNRQYDKDAPPLDEVLREDWRPARPELTDTTCHVLKMTADGRLLGFASYFGCHPVVCCATTRSIHGDFAGVASNLLEREHPGSVGLFLQGAQGDVNSCVVHKPEPDALLALDVIAARYARAVRAGLAAARPIPVDEIRCVLQEHTFRRTVPELAELRRQLAQHEAVFASPEASDSDPKVRMAAIYADTYRRLIRQVEAGLPVEEPTELQALAVGPIALLGAPFEIFQAIKNDIRAAARSPVALVMGLTNDLLGYAPDRTTAAAGGYAAQQVPLMLGTSPLADIHTELVAAVVELERRLRS